MRINMISKTSIFYFFSIVVNADKIFKKASISSNFGIFSPYFHFVNFDLLFGLLFVNIFFVSDISILNEYPSLFEPLPYYEFPANILYRYKYT